MGLLLSDVQPRRLNGTIIHSFVIREQNQAISSRVTLRVMSLAINGTENGQFRRIRSNFSAISLSFRFVRCCGADAILCVTSAQCFWRLNLPKSVFRCKNSQKRNEKNGRAWRALDWNVFTSGVSHNDSVDSFVYSIYSVSLEMKWDSLKANNLQSHSIAEGRTMRFLFEYEFVRSWPYPA